jgi:hypothetical protein
MKSYSYNINEVCTGAKLPAAVKQIMNFKERILAGGYYDL